MKRTGVAADFVDDVAQRHEIAGALGHLHRLAVAQQPHQLAQLHVERACPAGHRLHRRLHALDIAAMVGAPDVDHHGEAALELLLVIGDVGREIGVGAVGLQQRAVDVVAEGGGAEQRLLAILPVLVILALGRRQPALIDEPLRPQIRRSSRG